MVIDLASKSSRHSIFQQFSINAVRMVYKNIDPDANFPLTNESYCHSLIVLDLALDIQRAWPDVRSLLLVMAPKMERSEYRNEWRPFLQRGIQQSQKLNDTDSEGELSFFLGMLHLLLRQWELANIFFKSSLDCFEILEDNHRKARALNRLGYVAHLQRHYVQAHEYITNILNYLHKDTTERQYSYFVLGSIAFEQDNYQAAENYFRKSLAICEKENNKHHIGQRLLDIGSTLTAQKRFNEAMSYYEQSLILLDEVGSVVEHAIVKMNQGIIYSKLGDSTSALEHYQLAKPILYEVQDALNLARLYTNQAFDYYHLQRWSEAEHACMASIQHYEQLGLVVEATEALNGLGQIYFAQKNYEKFVDTFNHALKRLSKIKIDDPRYQHLYNEILSHIRQGKEVNY